MAVFSSNLTPPDSWKRLTTPSKKFGGGFSSPGVDRPPQPTLALKPSSGVTIVGQTLVFSCAAPPGEAERRFHLYREKVEVTGDLNATAEVTRARLKVRTESGQGHAGNFSCGYEEKTEGRWISSYLSPTVEVLVKGNGGGDKSNFWGG